MRNLFSSNRNTKLLFDKIIITLEKQCRVKKLSVVGKKLLDISHLSMHCTSHRVPHNSDCAQTRKNKQNTFFYNFQKLHYSNQF